MGVSLIPAKNSFSVSYACRCGNYPGKCRSLYGADGNSFSGYLQSSYFEKRLAVDYEVLENKLGFAAAFWWIPRQIDKRTENFQNDLMNRHYEEVENMYRTMRAWRHDYHNHIQAAHSYLELKKYDELAVYLRQLDENLHEIDQIVKTGNLMADAILNSKLALMREYHIRTEVTSHVPPDMEITDTELCILLGNLLDNAIEASRKVTDEQNRFIKIYMDTLQNQFYISIMNGMKGKAQKHGKLFKSTKPEQGKHGFGLMRVERIVEKYGGFLDCQSEEDVFATEVLLPGNKPSVSI